MINHPVTPARTTRLLVAAGLLSAASAALGADWVDRRQVGPFVVVSQFPLKPLTPTLRELPALEAELRRVLALRPCRQPLHVVLLSDETAYRRLMAARYPGVPHRRALFVRQNGQSTVYAFQHAELAIDLRHECTHALLHADLPMLPLWLDEGLAEYFELPADQRAFGNPHARELALRMRLGLVRGLPSLEAEHDLAGMTERDYQHAWAWTHFLLHGPEAGTRQLWAYLDAIRRGEPPGRLSARLDVVFEDPKSQMVRHFRGWLRLAARRQANR